MASVADVCGRLEALVAAADGGGRVVVVGVSGVPGSGKTTLVSRVVVRTTSPCDSLLPFSERTAAVRQDELRAAHGAGFVAPLPMDGFHLPRAALDAMPDPAHGHARRGSPFTFDSEGLVGCLRTLRTAGSGSAPGFDHAVGDVRQTLAEPARTTNGPAAVCHPHSSFL